MNTLYTVERERRDDIEVYTLADGGAARAEIAPALGNNCFAFRAGGRDVIEPVPFTEFRQKPTSYGIPILFPFPNRVRDGRFTFQGEEYEVDPPRHGFVRDKPWSVVGHGADDEGGAWLTSAFDAAEYPERILGQFPFPFALEVTYRLKGGALAMETTARNTGGRDMPVGFGVHPYFRRPEAGVVTVPASSRWALSDSLPTGETLPVEGQYDLRRGRSVDGLSLDDIFTEVEAGDDGLARCSLADPAGGTRTVVEFPAAQFPHVVVYTPPAPRRAICVEPNTCPTDAFNLHARGVESGLITLPPGAAVSWLIRVYTTRTPK